MIIKTKIIGKTLFELQKHGKKYLIFCSKIGSKHAYWFSGVIDDLSCHEVLEYFRDITVDDTIDHY